MKGRKQEQGKLGRKFQIKAKAGLRVKVTANPYVQIQEIKSEKLLWFLDSVCMYIQYIYTLKRI